MCIHDDDREIDLLLNPAPLRLEMGVTHTSDSRLVVAVRTDLQGCTGEMLDWWFRFFCTIEHFKWWHPSDHKIFYGWDDKWIQGENFIGATVHIVQKLGDIAPLSTKIKFCHPEKFFSARKLIESHKNKWVSAVICGYIGLGNNIILDEQNNPLDGRIIHLARDTSWGCVLRSRYIMGETSNKNSFFSVAKDDPENQKLMEEIGLGLMHHCYCEFVSLSHFLPSLYYGENAEHVDAPNQW